MAAALVPLLVNVGISLIRRETRPNPPKAKTRRDGRLQNVISTLPNGIVIYGKARRGGHIVERQGSGLGNKNMHLAIVITAHESAEFTEIRVGEHVLDPATDIGPLGEISKEPLNGVLWVLPYLGNQREACPLLLETPHWTENHIGKNLTTLSVKLKDDSEVFKNNPTFTARVKGKKVFDPRTELTAWSDNPALCVAD